MNAGHIVIEIFPERQTKTIAVFCCKISPTHHHDGTSQGTRYRIAPNGKKLQNNSTSDNPTPIIHHSYLSTRNRPLRVFECKMFSVSARCHDHLLILLTIADFCRILPRSDNIFSYPITQHTGRREQCKLFSGSHRNSILYGVLRHHKKCRTPTDLDPLSLSDRIGKCPLVRPDDFPRSVENISRFFLEFSCEKFLHRYFPDEAESLRIFSGGIGKFDFFRKGAHFRLKHSSNRENRVSKLFLSDSREKIRLIFFGIDSLTEHIRLHFRDIDRIFATIVRFFLCVMSCSNTVISERKCLFEK